jgi:phage terminase large subunit
MNLALPNNWHPRPYQVGLWNYLCAGGKRAVVCAHRRWGKDDVSLNHTACAMIERRANYGHMLPEYAQGRKAIWDAVNPKSGKRRVDEAFPLEMRNPSSGTNNQEMKITTQPDGNGRVSTWQVLGSDNYNSLMGTSYAGIVKSEEALSDPSAWAYLSPILRENDGWAMFISTPRGHNHFERLLKTAQSTEGWYGEVSSVERTSVFTPQELQMELVQLQDLHGDTFGKSLWLQEYFCSFEAAIPGSFWAESIDALQLRGAVCDFEYDRTKPVFTVGDLGRTDDTAIWFYQIDGDQLDIIDEWSGNNCEIYDPLNPERSICHAAFLTKTEQLGYKYARHWWPHDARPRRLGMGGKSILQQFVDAGKKDPRLGQFSIVPHLDVQEGIQAGRTTFRHVRRFHKTRCGLGLEALRHYHREWDAEKKMYLDHPTHDWSSHRADGWRYLSLSWEPTKIMHPDADPRQILTTRPTWGQMVERHFDKRKHQKEWSGVRS